MYDQCCGGDVPVMIRDLRRTTGPVGRSRFRPEAQLPTRAREEVAVVVHPEWRRVGLATALVRVLAEAALARGISTFAASFLTDNHPVAALLAAAGVGAAGLIADGIAEVQIPLAGPATPPPSDQPPRSTLSRGAT